MNVMRKSVAAPETPERSALWQALERHAKDMEGQLVRDLFASDENRFGRYSFSEGAFLLDLSKNRLTEETFSLLLQLAKQSAIEPFRDAMFDGGVVNASENRAALHTRLRDDAALAGESEEGLCLQSLRKFSGGVRDGTRTGATGQSFRHVVNIGIGGSHLGPALVSDALAAFADTAIDLHFVSSVDGIQLTDTLRQCDPARTLFVVSSKSFTTEETLINAKAALSWLRDALGEDAVGSHFSAVTANVDLAMAFGICAENVFGYPATVGGRFSLWSAVGLPVMISIGGDAFIDLLRGANAMDKHFRNAPLAQNMPVLLGLVAIWNTCFLNAVAHAVVPYGHRFQRLAEYLQQLEMESNGKGVTRAGETVGCGTAPVVFGAVGTESQHSFFQLLHQSPQDISTDLIAYANADDDGGENHDVLMAHFVAQSAALMRGTENNASAKPYQMCPGNRPTTSIVMGRLDPHALGMLLALYEHKVVVCAAIFDINPFDQWGVTLGKEIAVDVLAQIHGKAPADDQDGSTSGLLHHLQSQSLRQDG